MSKKEGAVKEVKSEARRYSSNKVKLPRSIKAMVSLMKNRQEASAFKNMFVTLLKQG